MDLKRNLFSGASNLHNGVLADAIRGVAAHQGKVAAAAVADFTADNSGGAAADGTVDAIPSTSATPASDDTCPTKAEVETSFGHVKNALTEIGAKIVAIAAVLPAFTPVNNIGGTAADGTIAAIDDDFAGADASLGATVGKTGFDTLVAAYKARIRQLITDVNRIATATGVAPLEGYGGGEHTEGNTYAVLSTDTGTAAADGTEGVDITEAEAIFDGFADAVAEMAAKLDEVTDDTTQAPTVFAA